MIQNKEDFIKSFFPPSVTNIDYTHINLDITDLSITDILRNINILYPYNSKNRNAIINGNLVVGVLCRTETLDPYNGLFLIITSDILDIRIASGSYIVMCINEENITSEEKLEALIDNISHYLVKEFGNILKNLPDFYRKFVYNERELYEEEYTEIPT